MFCTFSFSFTFAPSFANSLSFSYSSLFDLNLQLFFYAAKLFIYILQATFSELKRMLFSFGLKENSNWLKIQIHK